VCEVCGIATHVVDLPEVAPAKVARFAALYHADCRFYLVGAMLSMMADNIEHVITYWVIWEKFHSPLLVGFEVISHWTPFLFFSVYAGGLADRHDCRRVIQVAQLLYMSVSIGWGFFFLTNSLTEWAAAGLLVLHGTAGAIWQPAEQLMLHDIVGPVELPSAVRLNATFRSLGILLGPVVGSVLLLGLGPSHGIFVNAAIYLPLTIWLLRTRFTGHLRDVSLVRVRPSFSQAVQVMRDVANNPAIISMVVLGGLGSLFIGASLQPVMPDFAQGLGIGKAGVAYGALLFANGLGGVLGGLLLETTRVLKPTVRSAMIATAVFGSCSLGFALSHSYVLSLALLVVGGMGSLASQSIGQTVVQLLAPPNERGRVVGVYSMSSGGMRAGSGFTIGILGAAIGLHLSLALSAAALLVATTVVVIRMQQLIRRSRRGGGLRPAGATAS
jgi:MFS family permease